VTGSLLARGRDAEVFEHGAGLVLRRYREPRETIREAAVMQLARDNGVPVPEVLEVTTTDIVMERIDGPTLIDWAIPSPRRLRAAATILADLHERVHAIRAPDWLPQARGEGTALLHRDLHPLNVMMSASGPMLIDWANAARGPAESDVALTWVIMATSEVPGSLPMRVAAGLVRRRFVHRFLSRFDMTAVRAELADVGAARIADRNVTDHERERVRTLLAQHA